MTISSSERGSSHTATVMGAAVVAIAALAARAGVGTAMMITGEA
jgi:hypothetical protein